jgi:dTDP-4-dehydrorhamnose reductase
MRLLVTGAAGYLGSELVLRALARGWEVVSLVLDRPPPGGEAIRVDVCDESAVAAVLADRRPDAVVHTAYRLDGPDMRSTNVDGAAAVAHATAAVGARLVHLSTDLVFDGSRTAPYREQDEPRPLLPYGEAKLEAERLVTAADPGAVLVRTSLLYGGREPGSQERRALDAADGRLDFAFFTDEIRCPAHVADLASAVLELAARRDVTGPLHLAGPDAVSRYEFARLLASAHSRDADAIRGMPSPPGERPRNVALDSARAGALGLAIRGVRDALIPAE